jgi:alkylhydroperoxidase family enzyme
VIVWGLLAPGRKLSPTLRELAILRTAIVGECKFEYSQHLKVSQMPEAVVIPKEKLSAIKTWTTSGVYTAEERAVMAATDELIGRNMIEDATFAELKRHLSDELIAELFYVITTYRMHGMMEFCAWLPAYDQLGRDHKPAGKTAAVGIERLEDVTPASLRQQ